MTRKVQPAGLRRLGIELLEDRSVPAAGLAALGGQVLPTMVDAYSDSPSTTALTAETVVGDFDYDGVAKLAVTTRGGQTYLGSGSLLADANATYDYVLTAAHMVVDDSGRKVQSVTIQWPDGVTATADGANIFVHPGWRNDALQGNDIAVVRIAPLQSAAPSRYELYRDTTANTTRLGQPEIPEVFTKAGYGLPGTGSTGLIDNSDLFGTLRIGQNRYDDTYTSGSSSDWGDHTMLAYDFDSGSSSHDSIGFWFGIKDLGLGHVDSTNWRAVDEAFSAKGDSGGPSFLAGKIAGVTSFIMSMPFTDAVPGANASFGDIGVDTRVALFTGWVDSVMAQTGTSKPGKPGKSGSGGGNVLEISVAATAPAWIGPAGEGLSFHPAAPASQPEADAATDAPAAWAPPTGSEATTEVNELKWATVSPWAGPQDSTDLIDEFLGGVEVS